MTACLYSTWTPGLGMFRSSPLKIKQSLHFYVQHGSFVVDICRRCKKVLSPQRRAFFLSSTLRSRLGAGHVVRSPSHDPRPSQITPWTAPRGHEMAQERLPETSISNRGSGSASEGPQAAQERLERAPRGTQNVLLGSKTAPERLRTGPRLLNIGPREPPT